MGRGGSIVPATKEPIPGNTLNLKHMVCSFMLDEFKRLPDVMDIVSINSGSPQERNILHSWESQFLAQNEPYVVLDYPDRKTKIGTPRKLWKRRVVADQ